MQPSMKNSLAFLTAGVVLTCAAVLVFNLVQPQNIVYQLNRVSNNQFVSVTTGRQYITRFNTGSTHTNKGVYFPDTTIRSIMADYNGVIIYYGYDAATRKYPMIAKANMGVGTMFPGATPASLCLSRIYYAHTDRAQAEPNRLIDAFMARHSNNMPGAFFSKTAIEAVLSGGAKGVVFYYAAEGSTNPIIMTRSTSDDRPVTISSHGAFRISATYCPVCCGIM